MAVEATGRPWRGGGTRSSGVERAHRAHRARRLRQLAPPRRAPGPASTASIRASTSSTVSTSPCSSSDRADAAHPRPRVLSRQQHLGAEVALGHRQLTLGDAVAREQIELAFHDAQHLVDVLGRRAHHDGQRAGVLVGGTLGPHRVGEAALFAHLLEEPAREAAPQHVVEDGQRPAALVEARHRPRAVDEVRLLGRPAHHVEGDGVGARGARRAGRRRRRPRRNAARARRPPLVAAVAGDRDHHVVRAVVLLKEGAMSSRVMRCTVSAVPKCRARAGDRGTTPPASARTPGPSARRRA